MFKGINAIDFSKRFYDNQSCYLNLIEQKWGKGYSCSKCGYMALILLWHKNELANPFPVSRKGIMELADINSIVTYHKCLRQLED